MNKSEPAISNKTCRDCGMSIPGSAWKCPYCHEWQELTRRQQKRNTAAAGIIALLSLIVPGLGHLVMGMYLSGLFWMLSCIALYGFAVLQILPQLLVVPIVWHLIAVVTAGRAAASR